MITVYKKKPNPKKMELIEINDTYFNQYTSEHLDDRASDIIKNIDHSEMIDKYAVLSRFDNTRLNIDKISTGCKTALNILYNPDKVFDIRECGENALDVIYSLPEGNIYCEFPLISFDFDRVNVFDKNGLREINSYEKLKEWWQNED